MRWLSIALSLMAGPAAAAVVDAQQDGFQVRNEAVVAAPPDKVYAALVRPDRWWSPDHTFSHDPGNLTFEARAGGCWCETLPGGGSVQHMTVVYVDPGKTLRLRGAMGPMQGLGVDGALTWSIKPAPGGGSQVTQTLLVGGYATGGLATLAPVVDRVFGEQITRLKAYVETGRPAPG